ncbi:MAG: hypothetical protein ACE5IW_05875 [bacterium]
MQPTDKSQFLNVRIGQSFSEINALDGAKVILETVKDHRFFLVLRGDGLDGEFSETDPQATNVPALERIQ